MSGPGSSTTASATPTNASNPGSIAIRDASYGGAARSVRPQCRRTAKAAVRIRDSPLLAPRATMEPRRHRARVREVPPMPDHETDGRTNGAGIPDVTGGRTDGTPNVADA